MRSIFSLDINDLEQILISNQLPPDVTLEGIETRKDFDKLFKHRATPKYIAQAILKEKIKGCAMQESPDIKNQRLAIKKMELELRSKRVESVSFQQDQLYKRLQAIESSQNMIIRGITNLNELMERFLNDR